MKLSYPVLAMDASEENLSLAIDSGDGKLETIHYESAYRLSLKIHTELDHLMKAFGGTPESIGTLAICNGPGSFTSVRMVCMTADTLSAAINIPCYCLSTPLLQAYGLNDQSGRVHVIQNAYRGEVHHTTVEWSDTLPRITKETQTININEVSDLFMTGESVIGSGVPLLIKKEVPFKENVRYLETSPSVNAKNIIRLLRATNDGSYMPADAIMPAYVSRPSAEITYESKFGKK